MSRVAAFLALWLPLLVWMGLIFFFSSQPRLPGPPQPLLDLLLKKGGHFMGYGILAVLWLRVLVGASPGDSAEAVGAKRKVSLVPRVSGLRVLLAAWAVTVLYAISDEYHQSLVPSRHPGYSDVILDALGAATALYVVWRGKGPVATKAVSRSE
jgi:VanZ family protein